MFTVFVTLCYRNSCRCTIVGCYIFVLIWHFYQYLSHKVVMRSSQVHRSSLMWLSCKSVTWDETAAEYSSFQTDLRHRSSLVDSTPTTKEGTFEMPPSSSSVGSNVGCTACGCLLPSAGDSQICKPVRRWCHDFWSTIVLRFGSQSESGVLCACSVVRQIAILHQAVCLSAPVDGCVCRADVCAPLRHFHNFRAKSAGIYSHHLSRWILFSR